MIIKSICLTEGSTRCIKELFSHSCTIDFSGKVNLAHSERNGAGKTTLLRLLLYSFGYDIPNMRGIKFENCETEVSLNCESCGEVTLSRAARNHIVAAINGKKQTFVLPEQRNELLKILFNAANANILNNLLGAFYIDQEKGWTLLNRGVAIGRIRFKIEELIRGLSDRSCDDLIAREKELSRKLNKYRLMHSVAQYQETIERASGSLAIETYEEKINIELEQLLIEKKSLEKELRRIDRVINNNKNFGKFISEMKIRVRAPNGEEISVKLDNIVGYDDSIQYLAAKRKLTSAELASIMRKIDKLQQEMKNEDQQRAFWKSETFAEAFDRSISSVPINAAVIDKEIKKLEKELKEVRQDISNRTKTNNDIVTSLHKNIQKYAVELGVSKDKAIEISYLFTSNLKELSGATLHKTVFAFRLAYIIEIEKALGIKLPIIIDSPSGKEVDQDNIRRMIDVLKRDFADNQIIIASIFKYDFDSTNVIEIKDRLIQS